MKAARSCARPSTQRTHRPAPQPTTSQSLYSSSLPVASNSTQLSTSISYLQASSPESQGLCGCPTSRMSSCHGPSCRTRSAARACRPARSRRGRRRCREGRGQGRGGIGVLGQGVGAGCLQPPPPGMYRDGGARIGKRDGQCSSCCQAGRLDRMNMWARVHAPPRAEWCPPGDTPRGPPTASGGGAPSSHQSRCPCRQCRQAAPAATYDTLVEPPAILARLKTHFEHRAAPAAGAAAAAALLIAAAALAAARVGWCKAVVAGRVHHALLAVCLGRAMAVGEAWTDALTD